VIGAAVATARPASRAPKRIVLYALEVHGTQTTTWKSHATMEWCPTASQRLAFDGQGRQDLSFHTKGPVLAPMLVGGPPTAQHRVTMMASGQRQAALVAHYASLTDRPEGCDQLPTADAPAPAPSCGAVSPKLASAIVQRGHAYLATTGGVDERGDECPWLAVAFLPDGDLEAVDPGADHPDGAGAIMPLDLNGAPAPRPPFHPATARLHDTKSWHISFDGGRIDVTSTVDATVRIALKPTIVPGISIADARIGETVARLRRDYPLAHSDSGLSSGRTLQWQLFVYMPFRGPYGEDERVEGVATAPARGSGPIYDRPFSPSARVTSLTAASTLEVTAEGIGWGSTLAELRRTHRGHLWTRKTQDGSVQEWIIEGPGRRITALPIFQGVVGPPVIGCRAPAKLYNPVLDNARC
jgi:hypothetical protein